MTKIEAIEREYHDPAYIYGNNPRYTLHRRRRLEGCGEFEVYLELKNNIIKDLDFKGDFFLVGDLNALLSKFKNCPCTPEALRQVLAGIALDQYIMNLQPDELISLLMGE